MEQVGRSVDPVRGLDDQVRGLDEPVRGLDEPVRGSGDHVDGSVDHVDGSGEPGDGSGAQAGGAADQGGASGDRGGGSVERLDGSGEQVDGSGDHGFGLADPFFGSFFRGYRKFDPVRGSRDAMRDHDRPGFVQHRGMSQLATAPGQGITVNPFSHPTYTITRKFWTFLGRDFRVLDPGGNLCLYVLHKIFTWKDEWNVFADERQTQPLVKVKAREAIAINITHDVLDPATNAWIGSIRSRGFKSVIRDAWDVLDQGGNVVGELKEDSNGFLRRLFPTFLTMPIILGRWHLTINGVVAMEVQEQRTFFVKTFVATVNPAAGVDGRFAIGCALLALMRELIRERE